MDLRPVDYAVASRRTSKTVGGRGTNICDATVNPVAGVPRRIRMTRTGNRAPRTVKRVIEVLPLRGLGHTLLSPRRLAESHDEATL
jgi:hypothetical protein